MVNRYCRTSHSIAAGQKVEWMYSFDIHCNGYFTIFVFIYLLQLLLLSILLKPTFTATIISNSLYCYSFSYYFYVTFLGYMYLPFLDKDSVRAIIYPIPVIVVFFVLLTLINVNFSRYMLSILFEID